MAQTLSGITSLLDLNGVSHKLNVTFDYERKRSGEYSASSHTFELDDVVTQDNELHCLFDEEVLQAAVVTAQENAIDFLDIDA